MDRKLDRGLVRRRSMKLWLSATAVGAVLLSVGIWLPGRLTPTVHRSRIRTATVESGRIEAVIQATGTVVPAFEKVLSSPDEVRVVRILRHAGERVRPGDEILELDTSATRLDVARIGEQIAQKQNDRHQLRLGMARDVAGLESDLEAQGLDEELLRYRLEQQRDLFADGLTTEVALRQAEVELRKIEVELTRLRKTIENTRATTTAGLERLDLDISILSKERDEARHRLELASARSDRDGVLTWVVPQEGTTVPRGEVIARIADLGSFRVEADVSDAYSPRLAIGQPVRIKAAGRSLDGTLSRILPAIDNGAARFHVALEAPSDDLLRQNLRVDVLVVTEIRDDVPRVRKGPFGKSGSIRAVFVVDGDMAYRVEAELGLAGDEHYEVLRGLSPGDEVIISDMRNYAHLEQLRVK